MSWLSFLAAMVSLISKAWDYFIKESIRLTGYNQAAKDTKIAAQEKELRMKDVLKPETKKDVIDRLRKGEG